MTYKAEDFIRAIPGSGGIITAIASHVGCDWHTAKKYIDEHPTVRRAWENERARITDKAQHNIVKAVTDGDLQMSKWWLQVKDPEFKDKQDVDVTTGGKPLVVADFTKLTVEQLEFIAKGGNITDALRGRD